MNFTATSLIAHAASRIEQPFFPTRERISLGNPRGQPLHCTAVICSHLGGAQATIGGTLLSFVPVENRIEMRSVLHTTKFVPPVDVDDAVISTAGTRGLLALTNKVTMLLLLPTTPCVTLLT